MNYRGYNMMQINHMNNGFNMSNFNPGFNNNFNAMNPHMNYNANFNFTNNAMFNYNLMMNNNIMQNNNQKILMMQNMINQQKQQNFQKKIMEILNAHENKEEHPKNIYRILLTLVVLNKDKSIDFKEEHP